MPLVGNHVDPFDDAGYPVVDESLVAHAHSGRNIGSHIGIDPAHGLRSLLRFLPRIPAIAAENAVRMHAGEDPVHVQAGHMVQGDVVFLHRPGHQAGIPHLQMGGGEQRPPVGRQPGYEAAMAVKPHLLQRPPAAQVPHREHGHLVDRAVHGEVQDDLRHGAAPAPGLEHGQHRQPRRAEPGEKALGKGADLLLSRKPPVGGVHHRQGLRELFPVPEQCRRPVVFPRGDMPQEHELRGILPDPLLGLRVQGVQLSHLSDLHGISLPLTGFAPSADLSPPAPFFPCIRCRAW